MLVHVFHRILIHLLVSVFAKKVIQVVFVRNKSKQIHALVILVKHVVTVRYHHRIKRIHVFVKRILLANNVNEVIRVHHRHV